MQQAERQPRRWHRLDNTANLFPVITSRRFSNVYRISLNLTENVEAELLQRALETALPWFAAMRVRLRRGLFWHYLEHNPAIPLVREEGEYPCTTIDPMANNHFLFRMTYYGSRVNLEVFHVLTDGTGALAFFQAVLCQYFMLAHPAAFTAQDKETRWFAGHAADTEDSYAANYTPTKKTNFREGHAYKLKGERNLIGNLSVIHNHIALPGLKELCHNKGVTITEYLVAAMGWAVYTQQPSSRGGNRPVNVFIPVNLRPLFGSSTSLNFFSNIYVNFCFGKGEVTFDEMLKTVHDQFAEKVNRQSMLEKISYTVGGGSHPLIRVAPLPVKYAALKLVYAMSASSSTLGMTNLGRVVFPDVFAPYVAGAGLVLSCAPREPFKGAAISYGQVFTFTLSSTLRNMGLQRAIARRFAEDGLDVTIESNGVDYASL